VNPFQILRLTEGFETSSTNWLREGGVRSLSLFEALLPWGVHLQKPYFAGSKAYIFLLFKMVTRVASLFLKSGGKL
jgi:hypothetical protein